MSEHVLRAWERRYGVPSPSRTEGGFRLYSPAEEERLREMRRLVQAGRSPRSAAQALREADTQEAHPPARTETVSPVASAATELAAVLEAFDDVRAQQLLDRELAVRTQDSAIRDVVLPCMREIGARWLQGEVTIAQEHFASALLRGRLMGLSRGWSAGGGPRALLACPPQEQHDLGLICFGLTLRQQGWRITFLGADTPIETISEAARVLTPDLVVVSVTDAVRLERLAARDLELPERSRLAIAGPGATHEAADAAGAEVLAGDPVLAARELTLAAR